MYLDCFCPLGIWSLVIRDPVSSQESEEHDTPLKAVQVSLITVPAPLRIDTVAKRQLQLAPQREYQCHAGAGEEGVREVHQWTCLGSVVTARSAKILLRLCDSSGVLAAAGCSLIFPLTIGLSNGLGISKSGIHGGRSDTSIRDSKISEPSHRSPEVWSREFVGGVCATLQLVLAVWRLHKPLFHYLGELLLKPVQYTKEEKGRPEGCLGIGVEVMGASFYECSGG
ncbi:hypothetical protein B0H14DRAFT_2560231 [Mycena olivaceomarginata]|nr:hypothetical protein B0H14DRAFT_2560231 [Mycena olivaceomarginata]